MELEKDYICLPNSETHNCFGCSPINPSGLQMKFYANDLFVFSEVTVPRHLCGWNNLIHGGVLSTILDEIMSWAAIYLLKRITLTKSMAIEFLQPVYIDQTLRAEGKVLEVRGKHEAVMEGSLLNSDGIICTRSTANFAIFSPAVAKRLKIANEEHLTWFERIYNMKR
jgi:uncharacterized protein (TIGR00369 family)